MNIEMPRSRLAAISPFFIVEDVQASIRYYIDRLGFQLDFQGPDDDPYYGRVSRDGIGIMLKSVLPEVLPCPNRTRHEWARWDAFIYTLDPDALFNEFRQRGVSFVTELSFKSCVAAKRSQGRLMSSPAVVHPTRARSTLQRSERRA